jgi:hypothetical protein
LAGWIDWNLGLRKYELAVASRYCTSSFVLERCTAQRVSLMGLNSLFLQALETKRKCFSRPFLNLRRPKISYCG